MSNVITATFNSGETSVITEAQYQWATGQILVLDGIELPSVYRVVFSNSSTVQGKTQIGTDDGVIIPDVYFTTGKNIHAWVLLSEDDDDSEYEYDVTIPIATASEPEDDETTTEQESIITQAINQLATAITALNTATESMSAAVTKIDTLLFNINSQGELVYTYGEEESD